MNRAYSLLVQVKLVFGYSDGRTFEEKKDEEIGKQSNIYKIF